MRLLLAEDEKELSRALTAIFRHNSYSVDAVFNGREAYEYLQSGVYDGVVLDIMMPEMDGLTVLKKIREQGNKVPVLLLTAKAEVDDRVTGLDCGADDYLTKPFAAKELLARIRAMTRRSGEKLSDPVLKAADLSLDRSSCEVFTKKGRLRLANKEFQMLEMLMAESGRVIPAERFLEKVWEFDSEPEQNVVWVYISNLRKKLAAVGSEAQIKAYRNLGYSLEEKA